MPRWMIMRVAAAALAAVVLPACGGADDGAGVRTIDDGGTGTASGTGTGSATGHATGSATGDATGTTDS